MAVKKTVKLDHHHFGVPPDDPSFDLDRARKAHADVMARWDDPKEGDDFKGQLLMAIQNATAAEIEAHKPEIQAFINEFGKGQREAVGKAIVRAYVDASVNAAVEFGKDRAWHEQDWKRNHGQFSAFVGAAGAAGRHVAQGGYEAPQRAQAHGYDRSYGETFRNQALLEQAARITAATGPVSSKGQTVQFKIRDKKGNVRTVIPKPGELPKTNRGEKVIGVKGGGISGDHLTMGQGVFNLVQALGAPSGAAARTGQVVGAGHDFAAKWDEHRNADYGGDTGKAYTRIKHGAEALHTIAGNNPKAQVAVAVGRYVGQHGPEAEKVLGPHARRSAYKYRGVERTPRNLPTNKAGEQEGHDKLVARIARHIPTRSVHELNLASGYTAPSHGYLMDKNGKVHTEAHGYGDDHYLPFKLSGLHKLKNGSYIRTRSTGGPTTEDLYAASVSGARSFTVASRQGTYTVGFDPEFTHNKRFGDIALGMSKRYGKILDAVASGKVKAHGEVNDRQFDEWHQAALSDALARNDPDAQATALRTANAMRTAQEGKEGRQLSLDGEGYDYALQSLASQYPYYLNYRRRGQGDTAEADKGDPTGYFRPNDSRFHDVDGDTHYERIGNRGEQDSGYVKPRHLKTEHALVGYFDPSVAGETKTEHGAPSGSGKVKGNQAYYQNWANNPYNPKAGRPSGNQPQQRPQHQRTDAGAAPPRSTPQGSGAPSLASGGLDPEGQRLHGLVRALHGRGHSDPNIRQWASNGAQGRDEFMAAYQQDPHGVRNYVDGAAADSGLTSSRTHADSNPDVMDHADALAEHSALKGELSEPGAQEVRAHLLDATDKLYEQDSDKHADAGHYGGGRYHDIKDRGELLNMAFPSGTPNRKSLSDRANALMNGEQRAWKLEGEHTITDPHVLPDTDDVEPEDTSEVEHEAGSVPSAVALKNHRDSMITALTDAAERTEGRTKELIEDAYDAWANVDHATGAGVDEAHQSMDRMFRYKPQLRNIRVAVPVNGGGHQERKLGDLVTSPQPGSSYGKRLTATGVAKQWTVHKSGTKWIVRKAA